MSPLGVLLGLVGAAPAVLEALPERVDEGLAALTERLDDPASPGESDGVALAGQAHLHSAFSAGDAVPPPVLLELGLQGPWGLQAGLELVTTRLRPAAATWSPGLQALVTSGAGVRVELPRAFLAWRRGRLRVVLGTFEVGFAERLVLDTTRAPAPDGLAVGSTSARLLSSSSGCHLVGPGKDGDAACASGRPQTPDYLTREPLRGLAVSLDELPVGSGTVLAATAFVSWQSRRLYQYELEPPGACAQSAACPAPQVLLADGVTRVVSSSLPGVLDELLAGAHLALKPVPTLTVGATGYGALLTLPGPLGLQRWSRWPAPGGFGAVGVHATWVVDTVTLVVEAARSVDARPGNQGGGLGLEQRTVWSPPGHRLELSLRAYDAHFLDPHARPIAASDVDEGQRARNELGARLTWRWRPAPAWATWLRLEAWTNPAPDERRPAWTPGLAAAARVDGTFGWGLQAAAWAELRRHLAPSAGCAADPTEATASAEPCALHLLRLGIRLTRASPVVQLEAHAWLAGVQESTAWRIDLLTQAEMRWAVRPDLGLGAGARLLLRGLGTVEARLVGRLEATWAPGPGTSVRLRYEPWLQQVGPGPSPWLSHRLQADVILAW